MRSKRRLLFNIKTKWAIVLEGECEHWYIQMLKRNERQIGIDLNPKLPQKKSISEQYKQVIELSRIYDKVFWMIDCDTVTAESLLTKKGTESPADLLKKYISEIKTSYNDRVVVIRNNPCLEYWLLLHFEDTAAAFNSCNEANKKLKKHLPDYEKTPKFYTKENRDIYLQLKPNLKRAVERAKRIDSATKGDLAATISQMYLLFVDLGLLGE